MRKRPISINQKLGYPSCMFQFLKKTFKKSRSYLGDRLRQLLGRKLDADSLEELQKILYEADLGAALSEELKEKVEKWYFLNPSLSVEELIGKLKEEIAHRVYAADPLSFSSKPTVILIVGVNGNGKTTSIAKLAHHYQKEGKKVMLAAGDTFRAAAVDQLALWAQRSGVEIVKGKEGQDPAAVAFDALHSSIHKNMDLLLIDTAGRLETKTHLMSELEKVARVLKKLDPKAPHEVLMVIDATIGQNGITQARIFHQFVPLTGLILTKFDGSSKGGGVVQIQKELGLPIRFLGTGEGLEDLEPFEPKAYAEALLS